MLYAIIAGVLVALVCLAIIARNWSCRKPRPPRPPRPNRVESFEVVSVPTGNSIEVKAGRKGTILITLKGIGVPNIPGAVDAARANLEKIAGKRIEAEVPGRRTRGDAYASRLDGEVQQNEVQPDEEAEAVDPGLLEARSDFSSPNVKGETGLCLQLEQLKAGLAISVGEIPKAWAEAEKDARKAKRGVWK